MTGDFRRVADSLSRRPAVEPARMFGSEGLKIGGKVFCIEVNGKLVVKLSRDRAAALVESGKAERFDPGHKRVMKQWIAIPADSDLDWLDLAKEALAYVGQ